MMQCFSSDFVLASLLFCNKIPEQKLSEGYMLTWHVGLKAELLVPVSAQHLRTAFLPRQDAVEGIALTRQQVCEFRALFLSGSY